MRKKLLSLCLIIVMLFTSVPFVFADAESPNETQTQVDYSAEDNLTEKDKASLNQNRPSPNTDKIANALSTKSPVATPLYPDLEQYAYISEPGAYHWFSFVPEKTAKYVFESQANEDTYGYLYNSALDELASSDDDGSGNNFRISYRLTQGETYYFAAGYYSSSKTGTYPVLLTYQTIETGYIRNDYIEAYINSSGSYTIGTVAGDPDNPSDDSKILLYGHPDSNTTETLIRINGVDYYFRNYVIKTEINEEGTECIATALIDQVEIRQILTLTKNPYTNLEDVISIRYTYTNRSSSSKQVGVRIMLDTMLGSNDGSPFRVNGIDVTSELEFVGATVPQYWQSFDSLDDPQVTATGFFYYDENEKPDKVQFAYWPNIRGSSWDYAIDSGTSITGDSAVGVYFNPRTVAGGGSHSVVTYYGISSFAEGNSDMTGKLGVRITAPALLYGSMVQGGYMNNPFKVSVYIVNNEEETLHNIKATIKISDSECLTFDNSQPSAISIGDLDSGESASMQWQLRAIPQSASTTTKYTICFYEGSSLIKSMELSLILLDLSPESMYRTVYFDLNGGDGEVPPSQEVLFGTFLSKPADPTRSGYVFAGWYPNRSGSGFSWFNYLNLFLGNPVTSDMTLYAKWRKAQNLTYGIDTYSFSNSGWDFFGFWDNIWSNKNYIISGEYYDALLRDTSSSERADILAEMEDDWGGSCFGMSCVLSLVKAGRLNTYFFQDNAYELYDLKYPKDSKTIFNLINYYHLMQLTERTANVRGNYNHNVETANNRAIINALNTSAYPVVVGLNIYYSKNNKLLGGHAVVAYGYEDMGDQYKVSIWDPNDKSTPNYLYISKNYSTSNFDHTYDSGSYTSYIKYALTVESRDYDYKNIQEILIARGYSSGSEGNKKGDVAENNVLYLTTNYDSFRIQDSNGSEAIIVNGKKNSGDLAISDGEYLNEMGFDLKLEFQIEVDGDTRYIIYPEEEISVVTEEPLENYTTSLLSRDEKTGFYSRVSAEDTGTVYFDTTGSIETSFEESTHQEIVTAVNNSESSLYNVSVASDTTGLTVDPDVASTSIETAEDALVTINASDDYNTMTFSDHSVEAGSVILLQSNDDEQIVTLDGEAQGITHALVYYALADEPMDAQINIPYGECATEPDNPTRAGFVFDGWYTTPDYEESSEWSFDTPITENTVIYAKWLVDDTYTHTITFKAEGQDDVIYIVHDGEDLNAELIPVVPEREDYIGAWDIEDFTCIVSDLEVHAIYTHIHHQWSDVSWSWSGSSATATFLCEGCGVMEILSADITETVIQEPTCTEFGLGEYLASVEYEGNTYTTTRQYPINLLPHSWKEPVIEWAEDMTSATVTYTCDECGHETVITGYPYVAEVVEPTVDSKGYTLYYLEIYFEGGYRTFEKKVSIPKLIKMSSCSISLSTTSYTYNGKARTPAVTVTYKGKKLVKDTDYTVSYSKNKNVGTATVTIKGIGKFGSSVKKTFKINPKGTSISKLTAGSKKFTVRWKKQSTQTSGYQIQYCTNKSFKSGYKTVTIKGSATTSKTIKNLKAAKKYYVRIRTYKIVSGKKYYSSWSVIKSVTTKK